MADDLARVLKRLLCRVRGHRWKLVRCHYGRDASVLISKEFDCQRCQRHRRWLNEKAVF